MSLWTVTANRLDDGGVAYYRPDQTWTSDLQEAWVGETEEAAAPHIVWAGGQEHLVCDPYRLEVRREGDLVVPLSARERIRAEGPLPTLRRLGYPVELERERRKKAG